MAILTQTYRILLTLLALIVLTCSAWGREAMVVFCASGAGNAVQEIAERYENQTGQPVRLSLASSSTLARQIVAAAPMDVFVSANKRWMDHVVQNGFVDAETVRPMATNRLALVAAPSATYQIAFDETFDFGACFAGRLALGDPCHVPAGMYAREALQALGWWSALADRVAPAANVRAALQLVETGQCPLGIVYCSDAVASTKVQVIGVIPEAYHQRITFWAGVSPDADASVLAFADYLCSSEVASTLQRWGFAISDAIEPAPDLPSVPAMPTATLGPMQRQAVWLSIKVATCCVLLSLGPGVLVAWLLARKRFWGKSVVEALVHLPLVVPPVVTGYLALLVLGRQSVLGQWLEETVGVSLAFSWLGAVVAAAVMGFPLLVRSIRLAIELVDQRLEQAAAVLGLHPVKVFLRVTLPLALPGVIAGTALAFTRSLGEFGATITFAGNITGQTQTLSLAIYNLMQQPLGAAAAGRLALVSIALSLLALLAAELLNRRMRARLGSRAHARI